MPEFLRIWHQSGGCDYTIGCGIRVEKVTADSLDHARSGTIEAIVDHENSEMISSLLSVEIVELAGPIVRLDDAHWGHAVEQARQKRIANAEEERDRRELERLNKKYGAKS